MVTSERAVILDFGFAQERARLSARRPGAPPDGGTPNYMSPERLRSGGASSEDDIYALGLTLWEMWTCRVPEPGYRPRARPMRSQIMFDVPAGLSVDEVKQVFRCISDDIGMRPQARHMRFFNPSALTTSQVQIPRERLNPGPPIGRSASQAFDPSSQALLVTFATNAGDIAGRLYPLIKPTMQLGRRAGQDVHVPEPTVSGNHATMKFQAGSWLVEDLGSTNGTYADHSYDRKKSITLLHGGEVQLGECRFKLVSFKPDTPQHQRARQYLSRRDGLTGLLVRDQMLRVLEDDVKFAEWDSVPVCVARYEVQSPNRLVTDRPTILEMLALRRAAQRVVELTEVLLLSVVPVTAGRTGPLKFAIAMTGPGLEEARNVVEQTVSQVQGLMPETLHLDATLEQCQSGKTIQSLIDD
jgi:serine/threonine-protein kinase